MSKIAKLFLSVFFGILIFKSAPAKDDHHENGDQAGAHDHEEHEESGAAEDHEEAPNTVGPEKGILQANSKDGMKLSEQALKNFEIKTLAYSHGPVMLPKSAIFFGLQEKNIYRVRGGFFKRIDFTTLSKNKTEYKISSPDLTSGDLIVTNGLGFLRIAELAATGGAAYGHSH